MCCFVKITVTGNSAPPVSAGAKKA